MTEKITISRWDAAKFLESQEDIDSYLQLAFETGEPKQIAKAIGNAARAKGMLDVAKKTGLAREQLYTSFSESGNPTLNTLTAVVDTLGYQLTITPKTNKHSMFASY